MVYVANMYYIIYELFLHKRFEMQKEREEIMLPADPDMLASFLNMKLRDQYSSLDALCDDLELNKNEIVQKLKDADYDYIPARNQFL